MLVMKSKTALKRSVSSVEFLSFAVLVFALCAWRWPNRFTLIPLGIFSFTLIGDIVNIFYIRRKANNDPSFLDKKIP